MVHKYTTVDRFTINLKIQAKHYSWPFEIAKTCGNMKKHFVEVQFGMNLLKKEKYLRTTFYEFIPLTFSWSLFSGNNQRQRFVKYF